MEGYAVTKREELLNRVRKVIEAEGATIVGYRLTGAGHRRFEFEIAGRHGSFVFANSPRLGRDLKCISCARRVVRATSEKAS